MFPQYNEKLPTLPPKARKKDPIRVAVTADSDSSNHSVSDVEGQRATDSDNDDKMAAKKLPWWSRYSGYRRVTSSSPGRTIRLAIAAVVLGGIALVVLMVALFKTGHLSPPHSKVGRSRPSRSPYHDKCYPGHSSQIRALLCRRFRLKCLRAPKLPLHSAQPRCTDRDRLLSCISPVTSSDDLKASAPSRYQCCQPLNGVAPAMLTLCLQGNRKCSNGARNIYWRNHAIVEAVPTVNSGVPRHPLRSVHSRRKPLPTPTGPD